MTNDLVNYVTVGHAGLQAVALKTEDWAAIVRIKNIRL